MMDRKQASDFLAVSVKTIIRLEQNGKLTPIKYGGTLRSKVFYKKEEVLQLTNQKIAS